MNEKVKVTANPEGEVIITSEGSEYGYIRVVQQRAMIDESNGWLKVKDFSALIHGLVSDLNNLGWKEGQILPGKIVIREQLTPFNRKNPDKDFKIAGDTGIVCKQGDQPIYRNTFYSPNPLAGDVPVPHTNGDEIKAAYAAEASEVANQPDFHLD